MLQHCLVISSKLKLCKALISVPPAGIHWVVSQVQPLDKWHQQRFTTWRIQISLPYPNRRGSTSTYFIPKPHDHEWQVHLTIFISRVSVSINISFGLVCVFYIPRIHLTTYSILTVLASMLVHPTCTLCVIIYMRSNPHHLNYSQIQFTKESKRKF